MTVSGEVSWWWQSTGFTQPRPGLPGDIEVDVAIVGGGYSGLWTAYYLKTLQPDISVAVLEARFAGFGASGRNGGWLTNAVTGGRDQYVRTHGQQAAIDQQRASNGAVDEVIRVCRVEGIDADIVKGGELNIARTPAQLARLQEFAAAEAYWPDTDIESLTAKQTAERVGVDGVLGGVWHPHCARVHPVKLVKGLAEAVERLGVKIYEDTEVIEISPGRAHTARSIVRAQHVIRATEGFTANLAGHHRQWLPMNSSMIVTEHLPSQLWESIGWTRGEVLGDFAHVYMYAQRTVDDRIAFGGRGVPYRFGSQIDSSGETHSRTVKSLASLLREFFPSIADVQVAHAWSGVLGVPRDWAATVGIDRSSGLGWAGGYVGTGVTSTNLAGRTLADLILERNTDLTRLPWVGHRARQWEVEPLRWLAVRGIYGLYRYADSVEEKSQSRATATAARLADLIAGR